MAYELKTNDVVTIIKHSQCYRWLNKLDLAWKMHYAAAKLEPVAFRTLLLDNASDLYRASKDMENCYYNYAIAHNIRDNKHIRTGKIWVYIHIYIYAVYLRLLQIIIIIFRLRR